jgi:hypothetical protein
MKNKEILKISIINFFSNTNTKLNDGWANLADLGGYLKSNHINFRESGYEKLKEIALDNYFQSSFTYRIDTSSEIPVYFIKLKTISSSSNNIQIESQSTKITNRVHNGMKTKNVVREYAGITEPDTLIKASLRHLRTCEYMINHINDSEISKKTILHNIYYLSGYIFECVTNYAIFKFKLDDSIFEECTGDILKLKNGKYLIQHRYQKHLGKLEIEFSFDLNNLFNENTESKQLFDDWKTETRYKIKDGIDLNMENVGQLLKIANNLVKQIREKEEGK